MIGWKNSLQKFASFEQSSFQLDVESALQHSMIGWKNSLHNFSQSDAKTAVTMFSRLWRVTSMRFELALPSLCLSLPLLAIINALVLLHNQRLSYSCRLPFLQARPSFSSWYPVLQAHAKLPSVLTQMCAHLWPPDVLLHSSISVKINCMNRTVCSGIKIWLTGTLWKQGILCKTWITANFFASQTNFRPNFRSRSDKC